MITVPARFAAWRAQVSGEAGRRWVESLPGLVEELTAEWGLDLDDCAPRHGGLALVLLVHRHDEPLALKLSWVEDSTEHEAVALRTWQGRGAVRLVETRPETGALLLERVDPDRSLRQLPLEAAAAVAGRLLRRLAVPAPPGLHRLSTIGARIAAGLPQRQAAAGNPVPAAWLARATGLARDLSGLGDGTLIHADLHFGNILAGRREAWLAVDPRAVDGRPEYCVPELMWTRADELASPGDVRRLLTMLVEAAGLDPDAALGWTLVRCVDYWLWGLEHGLTVDPARCEQLLTGLG